MTSVGYFRPYWFYRFVMRIAHRFDWHFAPPLHMDDGSTLRWCQWCGLRYRQKAVSSGLLLKSAPSPQPEEAPHE